MSVGSIQDSRIGCRYDPQLGSIICLRTDDSHCDRIHSSLTAAHCFSNRYVGKQRVAWKEYCAEYRLKELQESISRCTGHCNITEILLKTVFNNRQSISQLIFCKEITKKYFLQ